MRRDEEQECEAAEDERRYPPATVAAVGVFASLPMVPAGGFRVDQRLAVAETERPRDTEPDPGPPWLVAQPPAQEFRTPPAPKQDLHRDFARLGRDERSILAFANRHGFLGEPLMLRDPELAHQEVQGGEPLARWRRASSRMGAVVAVWDAVRDRQMEVLAKTVRWLALPDGGVSVVVDVVASGDRLLPHLVEVALTERDRLPQLAVDHDITRIHHSVVGHSQLRSLVPVLDRFEPGDVVEPARFYVYREVNRAMRAQVSPLVLPFDEPRLLLSASTLLSALWLLFAAELAAGRPAPLRVCAAPGCGAYFMPADPRQIYCSIACRKRAHYHRHRAATGGGG